MNLTFKHDYEKDIWCLLNFGAGSNNSSTPTKVYQQLTTQYGISPSKTDTRCFIDSYINNNKIEVPAYITTCQKDWDLISEIYQERAEKIFGISLPKNTIAYLTINSRCPYNITENFYLISFDPDMMRLISMHELWHFYTRYKFGKTEEKKLGKQKYNDIKESLTTLLNIVYKDLFPKERKDIGYPQHQMLREKILEIWNKSNNIEKLWERISIEL